MMDKLKKDALQYSRRPKMGTHILAPMNNKEDLSLAYTPGIAKVCQQIQKYPNTSYKYTFRRRNLAVISDGSAVLGLGDIGHQASYPVMEGKSMLFKKFGNIDAIPIVISTQDIDEFVETVMRIADSFGAINLEDISAPRCFEIEKRLKDRLNIPVMHDDQHGTAVVVLAGLLNALKLIPHKGKQSKIVVNGSGSAGIAIMKLLKLYGFENIIACDSKGIISSSRSDLNPIKKELLEFTNKQCVSGSLQDALIGANIFIGVSRGNILNVNHVKNMADNPIIFAMSNPVPEIMPDVAMKAGAGIVGTGRSDFANQVNNALVFPGIFSGAMQTRSPITDEMKILAAEAVVEYHQDKLTPTSILPSILDPQIHLFIAERVGRYCDRCCEVRD